MSSVEQGEVVVTAKDLGDKWKADPASPRVRRGDRFVFKVIEGPDAVVWVPNPSIFGRNFFELNRGNNWTNSATILPKADQGPQAYSIYFYDKKDMAWGESPPKMIVDPGP